MSSFIALLATTPEAMFREFSIGTPLFRSMERVLENLINSEFFAISPKTGIFNFILSILFFVIGIDSALLNKKIAHTTKNTEKPQYALAKSLIQMSALVANGNSSPISINILTNLGIIKTIKTIIVMKPTIAVRHGYANAAIILERISSHLSMKSAIPASASFIEPDSSPE